jgi:hypothetical protein
MPPQQAERLLDGINRLLDFGPHHRHLFRSALM